MRRDGMKRNVKFAGSLILLSGFLLSDVRAQTAGGSQELNLNPGFFMAILAGLLLALGFQFVLTNFSVAAGSLLIPDPEKEFIPEKKTKEVSNGSEVNTGNKRSILLTLTNLGGIGGMLMAAVSLFFASLFAVKLSLISDNTIGFTLGMVIWAAFFLVVFWLESKAISKIMGGVFSAAVSAVKAGVSGIEKVFAKSETSQMDIVADHVTHNIEHELESTFKHLDLKAAFENYITKLRPGDLDLEKMKDKLVHILKEIKIEEVDHKDGKEFFLRLAGNEPRFSKQDISILDKLYDMAKSVLKVSSIAGGVTGAAAMAGQIPPVRNLRKEVETYLKKTGEPELQPEILQAELEEIFKHPSSTWEILKNKTKTFDKETVVSLVAAKQGVNRQEAMRVADKVEEAIDKVKEQVQVNKDLVENKLKEAKDKVVTEAEQTKDKILHRAEEKLREFFASFDRPELDYLRLKLDFKIMMKHPDLAPKILKAKLQEFDRHTLEGIVSANRFISPQQAKTILDKFEGVRHAVMKEIALAERAIEEKTHKAKAKVLEEAENVRETAIAASWWLFGTLVVSGLAAGIGGMLAL